MRKNILLTTFTFFKNHSVVNKDLNQAMFYTFFKKPYKMVLNKIWENNLNRKCTTEWVCLQLCFI